MDPILVTTGSADFAAIGYAAVRAAFNETLQLCADKLSNADLTLAHEVLGSDALDEDTPGFYEMLADTALFSRRWTLGARAPARRAIGRIAPKLPVTRDPLKSAIAALLPKAFFSVLEIEGAHPEGGVSARDLVDGGRIIRIMDNALEAQSATAGKIMLAGRFVDLGPWHIGFGIVIALRKSEAMAICMALSDDEELEEKRDDLHELLYSAQLHGHNLVMAALEPMIMSLAIAIDMDMVDIEELTSELSSVLPGKPAPKRGRKAAFSG
ncbi:MAG TPA: hypothetical protein VD713_06395 [Sphingomonadales bacterium]|nr:hypothetical protein [Sphingomonadales bacterium]